MYHCQLCKFDFPYDDIKLNRGDGTGICMKCYERIVEDEHPMSKLLRREVEEIANKA